MDPGAFDFSSSFIPSDTVVIVPPGFDPSTFASSVVIPASTAEQLSNSFTGSGLSTAIVDGVVDGVVDTLFPNNNGSDTVDANSLVESAVEGVVTGVAKFAFTKIKESISSHVHPLIASTIVQQPVATQTVPHVQNQPNSQIAQVPLGGYLSLPGIPPPPPFQQPYHTFTQAQSPPIQPPQYAPVHDALMTQPTSVPAYQSGGSMASQLLESQSCHLQPASAPISPAPTQNTYLHPQMAHHTAYAGHHSPTSTHPTTVAQQQQAHPGQQAQHNAPMPTSPPSSGGHSHQVSVSSQHRHSVHQQGVPFSSSVYRPGQSHVVTSTGQLARPSSTHSRLQSHPPLHSHSSSLHSSYNYSLASSPPPVVPIHAKPTVQSQHYPRPSQYASPDSFGSINRDPYSDLQHHVTDDIENYRPLLALGRKSESHTAPISLYGAAVSGYVGSMPSGSKAFGGP